MQQWPFQYKGDFAYADGQAYYIWPLEMMRGFTVMIPLTEQASEADPS